MFMHISIDVHGNFRKVHMIRKPLKVNITSRATLGPIGIASLELNINDQNVAHNFTVCTKLKHLF